MAKKITALILVFLAAAAIINYMGNRSIEFDKNLSIGDVRFNVAIADDPLSQAKGLSGQKSMCENCGMLFVYETSRVQNFWMKGMEFPLDFVFIREGKVVEVVENVSPPSDDDGKTIQIQSREKADMVLEVNAGFARENHLEIDSQVKLLK